MAKVFIGHDINELIKESTDYTNPSNFPFSKIIHQSWYNTKEDIPNDWKESKREWIKKHPGWLYVLWNKQMSRDFISKHEPHFLDTYDNFKYEIQRIDSMRYVVLKWLGGVYSDLDIVPRENIEKYFIISNNNIYLVQSANTPGHYTNAFMISKSILASDFWDLAIEKIKYNTKNGWYIGKWMTTMNTTGPILLTETVNDYSEVIGKIPQTFNLQSIHDNIVDKRIPVLINLNGGSWHSFDAKLFNFIYSHKWSIIIISILLIIIIIMSYFWYKRHYAQCKVSLNSCLSKSRRK